MLLVAGLPDLLHLGEAEEEVVRVGAESAGVVVDDVRDALPVLIRGAAQLVPDFEQLVDLLLVLGDDEAGARELDEVLHFARHRVLVDAQGAGADRLGRELGNQPLGPVVPQHGDDVVPLEAEFDQAAGEVPNALGVLRPGKALPDAELLLPERGLAASLAGIPEQQLGHRVRVSRQFRQRGHSASPR